MLRSYILKIKCTQTLDIIILRWTYPDHKEKNFTILLSFKWQCLNMVSKISFQRFSEVFRTSVKLACKHRSLGWPDVVCSDVNRICIGVLLHSVSEIFRFAVAACLQVNIFCKEDIISGALIYVHGGVVFGKRFSYNILQEQANTEFGLATMFMWLYLGRCQPHVIYLLSDSLPLIRALHVGLENLQHP